MGLVYEYLMFSGTSSEDFKAHISGQGTFLSPERDVETISVPGRNGDLHIDNGKFNNIIITYPAFITEDFDRNFSALKAFLLSHSGYEVLADSYHPDHYRKARFTGKIEPDMAPRNTAGSFELSFDCDPRLFLKNGVQTVTLYGDDQLYNRTLYSAKPLLRVYGTGMLTIAGTSMQITTAEEYTDIDCEIEEAFKGDTNCNGNIILTDGRFPELPPGMIEITMEDITRLDIIPRWWTV